MTGKPPLLPGRGAIDFDTSFRQIITPQISDFDQLGHVNNVTYLRWTQDIAIAHWETVAPPAMQTDYVFIALRHEIDYRTPLLPDDPVEGRTWLGRAEGPRFERYVDIRKPGAARASASVLTQWCLLDKKTRRPKRIGPDILEAFQVPG